MCLVMLLSTISIYFTLSFKILIIVAVCFLIILIWAFRYPGSVEEYDKRTNPKGQDYYWLTGKFVNKDKGEDTDEWALSQGFISVVPIKFDLTAHHVIQELNTWNFDK